MLRTPKILTACALAVFATGAAQTQIMDTPASHAVIMDHETGTILYSKNGSEPMIPASMTKMMTAFLVFELIERGEISLTDKFTVSEDAWRRGGFPSGTSTMGLAPGDTPTVEELLHGVIIMSGNDACIVLAQGSRQALELVTEDSRCTRLVKDRHGIRRNGPRFGKGWLILYPLLFWLLRASFSKRCER